MQVRAGNGASLTTLNQVGTHDRSHWQHGPIDIVTDLFGSIEQITAAKHAMWLRFPQFLPQLVHELSALRTNCADLAEHSFHGEIAALMFHSVQPYKDQFITPMAAVAGSVAQTLLNIAKAFELTKVIVNNGGDIGLFAKANERVFVALLAPRGKLEFCAPEAFEFGVATSGWSGRSFSLGIADAVTVVAQTASQADAAATMIANAVGPQIEHHGIIRKPANQLKDDTDLGSCSVTVKVDDLPLSLVRQALEEGQTYAKSLLDQRLILSASLSLQGESVIVHNSPLIEPYQFKLAA
jgi:uncharacterized protein